MWAWIKGDSETTSETSDVVDSSEVVEACEMVESSESVEAAGDGERGRLLTAGPGSPLLGFTAGGDARADGGGRGSEILGSFVGAGSDIRGAGSEMRGTGSEILIGGVVCSEGAVLTAAPAGFAALGDRRITVVVLPLDCPELGASLGSGCSGGARGEGVF